MSQEEAEELRVVEPLSSDASQANEVPTNVTNGKGNTELDDNQNGNSSGAVNNIESLSESNNNTEPGDEEASKAKEESPAASTLASVAKEESVPSQPTTEKQQQGSISTHTESSGVEANDSENSEPNNNQEELRAPSDSPAVQKSENDKSTGVVAAESVSPVVTAASEESSRNVHFAKDADQNISESNQNISESNGDPSTTEGSHEASTTTPEKSLTLPSVTFDRTEGSDIEHQTPPQTNNSAEYQTYEVESTAAEFDDLEEANHQQSEAGDELIPRRRGRPRAESEESLPLSALGGGGETSPRRAERRSGRERRGPTRAESEESLPLFAALGATTASSNLEQRKAELVDSFLSTETDHSDLHVLAGDNSGLNSSNDDDMNITTHNIYASTVGDHHNISSMYPDGVDPVASTAGNIHHAASDMLLQSVPSLTASMGGVLRLFLAGGENCDDVHALETRTYRRIRADRVRRSHDGSPSFDKLATLAAETYRLYTTQISLVYQVNDSETSIIIGDEDLADALELMNGSLDIGVVKIKQRPAFVKVSTEATSLSSAASNSTTNPPFRLIDAERIKAGDRREPSLVKLEAVATEQVIDTGDFGASVQSMMTMMDDDVQFAWIRDDGSLFWIANDRDLKDAFVACQDRDEICFRMVEASDSNGQDNEPNKQGPSSEDHSQLEKRAEVQQAQIMRLAKEVDELAALVAEKSGATMDNARVEELEKNMEERKLDVSKLRNFAVVQERQLTDRLKDLSTLVVASSSSAKTQHQQNADRLQQLEEMVVKQRAKVDDLVMSFILRLKKLELSVATIKQPDVINSTLPKNKLELQPESATLSGVGCVVANKRSPLSSTKATPPCIEFRANNNVAVWELNGSLVPGLYRAVLPICRGDPGGGNCHAGVLEETTVLPFKASSAHQLRSVLPLVPFEPSGDWQTYSKGTVQIAVRGTPKEKFLIVSGGWYCDIRAVALEYAGPIPVADDVGVTSFNPQTTRYAAGPASAGPPPFRQAASAPNAAGGVAPPPFRQATSQPMPHSYQPSAQRPSAQRPLVGGPYQRAPVGAPVHVGASQQHRPLSGVNGGPNYPSSHPAMMAGRPGQPHRPPASFSGPIGGGQMNGAAAAAVANPQAHPTTAASSRAPRASSKSPERGRKQADVNSIHLSPANVGLTVSPRYQKGRVGRSSFTTGGFNADATATTKNNNSNSNNRQKSPPMRNRVVAADRGSTDTPASPTAKKNRVVVDVSDHSDHGGEESLVLTPLS